MKYLHKHVEDVRWSGSQSSFFKCFQGYFGIFMDIDTYPATLAKWNKGVEGAGGLPVLFWNRKKIPILGKKSRYCFYLWVKFTIQNVDLIVSWRKKNSEVVPSRIFFFLCFGQNVYQSTLVPRDLPFPEKFLIACMHSSIILFAKRFILNV